jgi:phosphonate transport system substrate-binding protein
MQRRTSLSVIAVTATLWFGAAQAQVKEIAFGIISTESSANLKTAWQPLLDDMQKATGLKVNAFFAPDYGGVVEGMRFNKVQVAWMGNKSGMEAVDRAGGEVFAKVTQADGAQGYWSLMVVHKDSPHRTLDDVLKARANLTLGFGDPNSTSGALVPGYYAFAQNKVDATRDFKRMAAELREVWRSPLIASDPILWRKDLDTATKQKVRDFFLAYGRDAREKEILKTLTFAGFVPSNDNQLLPIRQLELARERGKVEGDANMAAGEKSKRLNEIDGKLSELTRQLASAK